MKYEPSYGYDGTFRTHFSSVIKASEYNGGGEKALAPEAKKMDPTSTLDDVSHYTDATAGERGGQFDARLREADSLGLRKMTDSAGGENIKLK